MLRKVYISHFRNSSMHTRGQIALFPNTLIQRVLYTSTDVWLCLTTFLEKMCAKHHQHYLALLPPLTKGHALVKLIADRYCSKFVTGTLGCRVCLGVAVSRYVHHRTICDLHMGPGWKSSLTAYTTEPGTSRLPAFKCESPSLMERRSKRQQLNRVYDHDVCIDLDILPERRNYQLHQYLSLENPTLT